MQPIIKNNLSGSIMMMIGFILICFLLSGLSILFNFPETLPLLLSPLLLLGAVKRSIRYSLCMFGVLFVSMVAAMFFSFQNWTDGAVSLVLISLIYFTAIALIYHIQVEHKLVIEKTTERVEQAELNQRVMTQYAPHFEFWIKPDGQFGYVSAACKRMMGIAPEELMQNATSLFDRIDVEDRSRILFELTREKKKNGEIGPFEFLLHRADGEPRRLEMVYHQAYDERGNYLGKRGVAEDITDRWQAELSTNGKVERLTLALESANEGMWDFDLEKGLASFNQNYARTLNIPVNNPTIPILEFYNKVHPEDIERLINILKSHLLGKTSIYEAEYRLKIDNEWRWVLDRGRVAERDFSGKAVRLVGVHIDISERKRIEQALIQSETKFRQVAENMREVFWLFDCKSKKFVYISPAFLEIWGRSPEVLYETPNLFFDTIHPDDINRVLKLVNDLTDNGKELHDEFRIVNPSGKLRWIWSRAYPIYENGAYYRIAGFVEDITVRKISDLSLRESEKRYRDLIEQQGGGVGIFDPDEKIIYINPAGEEIFGFNHGDLVGRNLVEFLSEDQANILVGQTALRRQGVETSYELVITRPDGETRSLLFTATPRFDANNQFLGNIVIFRDISQSKQKEERLLFVSQHDTLTGLYNRGVFDDEIIRLDQGGQFPVGIIMVDADRLKEVNDRLGHARGDDLLISIAGVLKSSVRDSDIVARLGGDEFGILLPLTDKLTLERVINRIYEQLAEENNKQDNSLHISISTGGMVCNEKGGLKEAMKQADLNMYEVKNKKKANNYILVSNN